MNKSKRANIFVATSILVSLVLLYVTLTCEMYTERVAVCAYTGSLKGHTEWFTGAKTRYWQVPSALEEFVKQHAPDELEHNWRNFAVTGKNAFGDARWFGHGPRWPTYSIRRDLLSDWIESSSVEDVMALYDFLRTADYEQAEARLVEMDDQGLLQP